MLESYLSHVADCTKSFRLDGVADVNVSLRRQGHCQPDRRSMKYRRKVVRKPIVYDAPRKQQINSLLSDKRTTFGHSCALSGGHVYVDGRGQ